MVMTDKTINLDQHRGMAQATDLRRLLADVEANERALLLRQDELESHLIAAPAANLARSCREGPLSSQSLCCYVDVGGSAQTRVHRGRAGRLQAVRRTVSGIAIHEIASGYCGKKTWEDDVAKGQLRSNREKKKPKADKNKIKAAPPASPFASARFPGKPAQGYGGKKTP
jgi:hypothetical protein